MHGSGDGIAKGLRKHGVVHVRHREFSRQGSGFGTLALDGVEGDVWEKWIVVMVFTMGVPRYRQMVSRRELMCGGEREGGEVLGELDDDGGSDWVSVRAMVFGEFWGLGSAWMRIISVGIVRVHEKGSQTLGRRR